MTSQADLERARSDASYRPKFISRINLEECGQYVNSVVYCPRNARFSNGGRGVMCTVPPVKAVAGIRGSKSKIIITPYAFSSEMHENLDDFLSSLIDHEGLGHAKSIFEGEDIRSPTHELYVLFNHKERLRKRNCSDKYFRIIMQQLALESLSCPTRQKLTAIKLKY